MTTAATPTIRSLFSTRRPIDRPIEKVIDYYTTDPARLQAEIEEYEVTDSVVASFRRFLDLYGHGVRTGQVTEIGVWVSGFYGSGKSSFTKYLGFALDPRWKLQGRPFLDFLLDRIQAPDVKQELKALAVQQPVAVVMLDLGSEQLASSASHTVSTVLYWKVLQQAGYSKEEKLAQLEFRLDRDGRLDEFKQAYSARFGGDWEGVHNDPLVGVSRADQLVSQFYPKEFPQPGAFRSLRFSLAGDLRDRAAEIIDLVRRKSGHQNILFLIDETGQYVAPRGELILNLDGLVRNFKELGQGRVWVIGTGQQTLPEIVERAAFNSPELNKLRDRFPISIELDARDIREITHRRLLTKSAAGETFLSDRYRRHGQSLAANTRLTGSALFKGDPDEETFKKLYPFLPQHFDLLLELIRRLARSTGGIGLRSAIRVIQDLLVDSSKVMPPSSPLLADAPAGRLATADLFYDTLRADINKSFAHVVSGVDRAARVFPGDTMALRVARAIAALQPIDGFPRTAENLSALLYAEVDAPPHLDAVRAALQRLMDQKEIGLIQDPQEGGYSFLSEKVRPLREQRDRYVPTRPDMEMMRVKVLERLFDPAPSITLEKTKTVRAGVRLELTPVIGAGEEVQFRIVSTDSAGWDQRRTTLLADTIGSAEWKMAIAWLVRTDESLEDILVQVIKSRAILGAVPESGVDGDMAQFLRSERNAAETNEGRAKALYQKGLMEGTLIFRGNPVPAQNAGAAIDLVARKVLQEAAEAIYPHYRLVPLRAATDLAITFLSVERLDRMSREADPLGFVTKAGGKARVDPKHPALAEALRAFEERLQQSNASRLQGLAVQDMFSAAPYGWSKDATRYVFAALLMAGVVVLHTPSGEVRTSGPAAMEALRTTQNFSKAGVAMRQGRPKPEELDRAASQLESLFGQQVLPLEDQISRAIRERLPARLDPLATLETQCRLLELPGEARARQVYDTGRALLELDGAGAIGILGPVGSGFVEDVRWAESVAQELARGGEATVRSARSVIQEVDGLAQLFPSAARVLVEDAERDLLKDVLALESFHTRLADLRGVESRVRRRALGAYGAGLATLLKELEGVRNALEATPEWMQITEEDRTDLARRLVLDLPETPVQGQEINQLRIVLTRQASLAGLEQSLRREMERRVPPLQDPTREDGKAEAVVDMADLLPAGPLRNNTELLAWLDRLRAQLEAALEAGGPLRLRIRR